MISTVLAEHVLAVRIGFWVVLVVAGLIGWLLHRMRSRVPLLVLSAIGLVGALVLTMTPDGPGPGGVTCTVQVSAPFQGIDTLANVALLLPLSLFLGLATRRPVLVLAGVSALSAVVECVQAVVPALGRACDTNDWVMNTVGAVLGAVVASAVLRLDRRGSQG